MEKWNFKIRFSLNERHSLGAHHPDLSNSDLINGRSATAFTFGYVFVYETVNSHDENSMNS